jgi:integrase
MCYFGPWADPDGALRRYQEQREDLYAGREPQVKGDGLCLRDLVNRFLTNKRHLLDTHELRPRTFQELYQTCGRLIAYFGRTRLVKDLTPEDFSQFRGTLGAQFGPVRLGNEIGRVRGVFKFASDSSLIDKPVNFGPSFKKPSRKTMRLHRASMGPRMFEAHEIRAMLDAANVPLKAMILLGINAGYGNGDCAGLAETHLDLEGGWVTFPRPKTGIPRRAALWPETVAALRDVLAMRPKARDKANDRLVFLTGAGRPWVRTTMASDPREEGDKTRLKVVRHDRVTKAMRKLLDRLGINGNRGFYALRHGCETIGGESGDQVAVNSVMGHVDESISAVYRERVSDARLRKVSDFIHAWLFASPEPASVDPSPQPAAEPAPDPAPAAGIE